MSFRTVDVLFLGVSSAYADQVSDLLQTRIYSTYVRLADFEQLPKLPIRNMFDIVVVSDDLPHVYRKQLESLINGKDILKITHNYVAPLFVVNGRTSQVARSTLQTFLSKIPARQNVLVLCASAGGPADFSVQLVKEYYGDNADVLFHCIGLNSSEYRESLSNPNWVDSVSPSGHRLGDTVYNLIIAEHCPIYQASIFTQDTILQIDQILAAGGYLVLSETNDHSSFRLQDGTTFPLDIITFTRLVTHTNQYRIRKVETASFISKDVVQVLAAS